MSFEAFFDNSNCHVKAFDTVDGVHRETAVNVEKQLLELLDEDTQSEEIEQKTKTS